MVAARSPTVCAMRLRHDAGRGHPAAGSPVTPRRSSAIAVVRIGGIQPSRLARSPSLAPRSSRNAGSAMRGHPRGAERPAELIDHVAERDRLLLHQVPCHGVRLVVDVARRKPGDGRGDVLHRDRLERRCPLRRRADRAETPPARAAWRCRHRPQAPPQSPAAGSRKRMPEAAISRSASRLVVLKAVRSLSARAGNRDMDQADRTAAVADRLQQPRDEIAMHGGGVAAGAILQHAEAIDDDIDARARASAAPARLLPST